MNFQPEKYSNKYSQRCYTKMAAALLLFLVSSFTLIPNAEAACTGGGLPFTGGTVDIQACDDVQASTNVGNIDVPVPAGTINSGDMLIAVVGTDDVRAFGTPTGWILLQQGSSDSNSLAVYKRISGDGGPEPASYNFSWAGNSQAYGFMLHLTDIDGNDVSAQLSSNANDGTPPAPAIAAGSNGDLIIRIAGLDQTDGTGGSVPAGHTEITRQASGGGNNGSNRVYAGYLVSDGVGPYNNINFTGGSNEEYVTVSLLISQGSGGTPTPTPLPTPCPTTGGLLGVGGPLVFYEQCEDAKEGVDSLTLTVDVPDQLSENDLMVAVMNLDGARPVTPPPINPNPGGTSWIQISETAATGVTLSIFQKFVDATEPANYTWSNVNDDQWYGYIMGFSGASGLINIGSVDAGADNNPTTSGITVVVDDTLTLHVAVSDDDDVPIDPGEIVSGFGNITSDSSALTGAAVSGQAVYKNEPSQGASDTAVFTLDGGVAEAWKAVSLGIEPIEFRFSMPDEQSSVCGVQQITLQVTDGSGGSVPANWNTLDWFEGTVTISATNSGTATWGGVAGENTNGVTDNFDGTATYTFDTADSGELVLEYYNPVITAEIDFDVIWDVLGDSSIVFNESTHVDYLNADIGGNDGDGPELEILDCEFRIAYDDGTMGSCGIEQMTISLVSTAGEAAQFYSGTVTINDSTSLGSWANPVGDAVSNFADGIGDIGSATWDMDITVGGAESNQITLDYSSVSVSIAPVDFDLSEDSAYAFSDDDGSGTDPDLAILLCEFRILYTDIGWNPGDDLLGDTCTPTELIVQVVDDTGFPFNYTGSIRITPSVGAGDWDTVAASPVSNPGSLSEPGLGVLEYTFVAGDGGEIVLDYSLITDPVPNVDFNIIELPGSLSGVAPPSNTFDNDIDIAACTVDIDVAATMGNCSAGETVSIRILDRSGSPASGFDSQIQITTGSVFGDFALTPGGQGGNGTFNNVGLGVATYTFDPLAGTPDAGELDLDFSSVEIETLVLAVTSLSGIDLDLDAGSTEDLDVLGCEIRVRVNETADTGNVCSASQIEFEITDSAGNRVTGFSDTIDIAVDEILASAVWTGSGVTNFVVDGGVGDGTATYTFTSGIGEDNGIVVLDFFNDTETPTGPANPLGFDVTATAANGAALANSGTVDEELTIVGCQVEITVLSATSELCRNGGIATFQLQDNTGTDITGDYIGTLVVKTAELKGDFELVNAHIGMFTNLGNGSAIVEFVAGDGNSVDLRLVHDSDETLNINAFAAGITENNDGVADSIDFNACQFVISVTDTTTDVCSFIDVTIELFESDGVTTVDDYEGTISLSTTTGNGTWSNPVALGNNPLGAFSDTFPEDGIADYNFDQTGGSPDGNEVILRFTNTSFNTPGSPSETLNINVTDGTTDDLGNVDAPNDPDVNVADCTFEISYDGFATFDNAETDACSIDTVSIRVMDRDDVQAADYGGTVSISTSTNLGGFNDDVSLGNFGTLTDGDLNDGLATYQFVAGVGNDNGEVDLFFEHFDSDTVNFNLDDGEIEEDGAADPDLEKTSCLPALHETQCYNAATGNIEIPAYDANVPGRILLMLIAHEGTTDVSSATFDNGGGDQASMTLIYQQKNSTAPGNTTEIWGLLDDDGILVNSLPQNAVDTIYSAEFAGGLSDPSMCLLAAEDVSQLLALPSGTTSDPVNGTSLSSGDADIATTITTSANNALVVSVASHEATGTFNDIDPSPPIARLFNGPNPANAVFGGSSGRSPTAAALTVTEGTSVGNAGVRSQIVASFDPFIAGAPVANGYEPVSLFKTYSGNLSYRAIGNTMRSTDNGGGTCNFLPGMSSVAPLDLPDDPDLAMDGIDPNFNSITAAYLYWAANGEEADQQNQVNFGVDGSPLSLITADDVFQIVNAAGTWDFWMGYKDVTSLVALGGEDDYNVTFQATPPTASATPGEWNPGACMAGWSMVVVYENEFEQLRVLNLFHGFQPFRYSEFTLVPRNFRMATENLANNLPNGQITHISFEGDESGNNSTEGLALQDDLLDATSFTALSNPDFNPSEFEFNSTITRPVFEYDPLIPVVSGGLNGSFQWIGTGQSTDGIAPPPPPAQNTDGYEIDFPGPNAPVEFGGDGFFYDGFGGAPDRTRIGDSWGVDIDTHYLSPSQLSIFAQDGQEAEEITTKYSSEADLVVLAAEVISVTNFPIADIEIFKSATTTTIDSNEVLGTVEGTGQYQINVTNNGSGAIVTGFADGQIIVSDTLPVGMTFASATDVSGDGWDCGQLAGSVGVVEVGTPGATPADPTVTPGAFTCVFDIAEEWTLGRGAAADGQLAAGEFLPEITVDVALGGSGDFPNLNNSVENIARVVHVGYEDMPAPPQPPSNTDPYTSCIGGLVAGVSPDPDDCTRAPQFDNVNDLQGGTVDLNDVDEKTSNNNNVSPITVFIRGVETDLGILKLVTKALEEGSDPGDGQFTILVTNNGPDATTADFTVADTQPSGVTFYSVSDNDTVLTVQDSDWDCSAPITPNLNCTYVGAPLLNGASKSLVLNVTVTGVDGDPVNNTAVVAPGDFNFDENPANDSDTTTGTFIIAPPVGSTEKFLLSVNALGGLTDIGGLTNLTNNDLFIYDPLLDQAENFLIAAAESEINPVDINATHLLPNGHVVISVNAQSTSTDVATFEPGDLVVWDPLEETTILLFEGSSVFTAIENIDAVYVYDEACDLAAWPVNDCKIAFSTVGPVDIGDDSYGPEDIILYDPTIVDINNASSFLVEGADSDIWDTSPKNIDAFYARVDTGMPPDPETFIDTYALSIDDISGTIGADTGHTPLTGTSLSRDDIVQIDRSADETELLFRGNIALGVFSPVDNERRLDALHILETGYLGHFRISQSQAGSTCAAGQITISKRMGLEDDIDTNYFGTIEIVTDSAGATESWGVASANGTLTNLGNGAARYTFVPSDNGEITLNLAMTEVTEDIDINITNGVVTELGAYDPTFDFQNQIILVSYRDEFNVPPYYATNNGSAAWASDWTEANDDGDATTGLIIGNAGQLNLTADFGTPGGANGPSIERYADMTTFDRGTQPVNLSYGYSWSNTNFGTDTITVEIRDNDSGTYYEIITYDPVLASGSNTANFELTDAGLFPTINANIDFDGIDLAADVYIRFRVSSGYTIGGPQFNVDNVDLNSGTTDCNIGAIDHYDISHGGTGISCLGSTITVTGHNALHDPTAPGDGIVMALASYFNNGADVNRGTWSSVVGGSGAFTNNQVQGTPGNGVGSYTWFGNENQAQFRFNYTQLDSDPETVFFDVGDIGTFEELPAEDQAILISQAGLRFFNESDQTEGIPTQISGKRSDQFFNAKTLILQALTTSPEDPSVCEPLFPNGQVINIEFAAECDDPDSCSNSGEVFGVNGTPIEINDQDDNPGSVVYTSVPVTFSDQTTSTGAEVYIEYSDAGQIELHAQYDQAFDNNPNNPVTSGDYIVGSDVFVVRPFGFDIDFSFDRRDFGIGGTSYADPTNSASVIASSVFAVAGLPFSTTVSARVYDDAYDDNPQDGNPDLDADLSLAAITPNFDDIEHASSAEDDVTILHTLVEPSGGVTGVLTGGATFTDFFTGAASKNLTWDEVGIITLNASLFDHDYLGSGEDVLGSVVNVGRFRPDNFILSAATAAPVYSSGLPFTYMGQEFDVSFILEANKGGTLARTQNYVGDFVKMDNLTFDNDSIFHGVEDIVLDDDVDYSGRMSSVDGSFSVVFDDIGDADPGTGGVMGDLIFNRENDGLGIDGAEDGPYSLRIGTSAQDDDGVLITLSPTTDIDVDENVMGPGDEDFDAVYRELSGADVEFRYGRLVVNNTYGPETEDLEVSLRVEYWNGTEFILNSDDSGTLVSDWTEDPALSIVPLSYFAPDLAVNPLDDAGGAEIVVEQIPGTVDMTLSEGESDIEEDDDGDESDRPFRVTAPLLIGGETVTPVGGVLLEFDLSDVLLLPGSLEFLGYDWRGGTQDGDSGDLFDDIPENLEATQPTGNIYNDNPRGIIEFGSYRGHDRIINWQEIYLRPSL